MGTSTSIDLPAGAPVKGRRINNRYRLEQQIGEGGMAAVYKAYDEEGGRSCAVKLLHGAEAQSAQIVQRFCDEAFIIARLCHPNIVKLYDAGQAPDGNVYLVMELLQGKDLGSFLQTAARLSIESAIGLICEIGSALHTVHLSGIIHRDRFRKRMARLQAGASPRH